MSFWYIGIVAIYLWFMLQIISSSPPFIIWLCLYCFLGFPGGSVVKILPATQVATRDMGSTPGLGRSPGGGHGNPLQYSCLGSPMDIGAWWATPIVSQRAGRDWSNLAHTYCFLPGSRFLVYFINKWFNLLIFSFAVYFFHKDKFIWFKKQFNIRSFLHFWCQMTFSFSRWWWWSMTIIKHNSTIEI